jgi:SAM-dependent methyltransferase
MNWRDYWNADTPIYVSERHKLLHYRGIANDIVALIRELGLGNETSVLDHGCGEALSSDRVAAYCAQLTLSDTAPLVRERLTANFAGKNNIKVASPEEVEQLADGSLDLVIANSLLQYLTGDELFALLGLWKAKLKPQGRLVLADVLPRDLSPVGDALALLRFAGRGGFLTAALIGLVRTALSDYRKIRQDLGLAHYDEAEMIALLGKAGFSATRRRPNLGHNDARMTFIARPI